MEIQSQIEKFLEAVADGIYANVPQKRPTQEALQNCKIISHRGEHDNRSILENTLSAFDTVLNREIWGIELDIRWTKDLKPVVIHDPDCQRVFGSKITVGQVSLNELKSKVPLLPTLEEVIQRYGKKIHLMVELKEEHYPDPRYQSDLLKECFSSLVPQEDFHFISLTPDTFQYVDFVPKEALLLVAEFNFRKFSELALKENYGGLTGHYLLMSNGIVQKHEQAKQKIGTGFPASKNCLLRELNRGVEWVFSNQAVKLRSSYERLLQDQ